MFRPGLRSSAQNLYYSTTQSAVLRYAVLTPQHITTLTLERHFHVTSSLRGKEIEVRALFQIALEWSTASWLALDILVLSSATTLQEHFRICSPLKNCVRPKHRSFHGDIVQWYLSAAQCRYPKFRSNNIMQYELLPIMANLVVTCWRV